MSVKQHYFLKLSRINGEGNVILQSKKKFTSEKAVRAFWAKNWDFAGECAPKLLEATPCGMGLRSSTSVRPEDGGNRLTQEGGEWWRYHTIESWENIQNESQTKP